MAFRVGVGGVSFHFHSIIFLIFFLFSLRPCWFWFDFIECWCFCWISLVAWLILMFFPLQILGLSFYFALWLTPHIMWFLLFWIYHIFFNHMFLFSLFDAKMSGKAYLNRQCWYCGLDTFTWDLKTAKRKKKHNFIDIIWSTDTTLWHTDTLIIWENCIV